jgi:hypothetical protein
MLAYCEDIPTAGTIFFVSVLHLFLNWCTLYFEREILVITLAFY